MGAAAAGGTTPGLVSLGAFAGGLILSNSRHTKAIQEAVKPVVALFATIFFVLIGTGIDLSVLDPTDPANRSGLVVAVFLLLAAIVAFPAPFRKKLWGMVLGLACLVVANYARVVSLWFIGVHWPTGFDAAHFSVWPLLLICCAMGLFLRWLRYAADAPRVA
jgi:exosortase/archaeosortase family protein